MRLKENIDIIAFLKCVKNCRQEVYFDSAEGDHLDLKSALSQYVLTASLRNGEFLQEGCVACENEEDYEILRAFLIG